MKTIKQIADELGVSKQAVRKKITLEIGNQFAVTKGNTVYISEQGESLIKSAFLKSIGNQVTSNKSVTIDNLVTTLQEDVRAKNQQISDLTAELSKEREHNREISNKLAVLTENAQTLHLGTIQQQLLPEASAGAGIAEESPSKRRGFFGWLDKRKQSPI